LVYLYCAHYEWEKAEYLMSQYCFEGSEEEIKMIYWLCNKLPASLKEQSNIEPLSNSHFLAIQLKALSNLIHLPPQQKFTDNGTQNLFNNLPQTISTLYDKYHVIANNLPEDKKLPKAMIESLANENWILLERKKNELEKELERLL